MALNQVFIEDEDFPTFTIGLARYFASGEGSDMKIKCGAKVYNVHRIIVCAQCRSFADAMNKDHGIKEAQTKIIDLDDDDPAAVLAGIVFMYTRDYIAPAVANTEKLLQSHLSVYHFADKYGIGCLREFCAMKLERLFDAGDVLRQDFLRFVQDVYGSLPDNDNVIDRVLVMVAAKNIAVLAQQPAFTATAGSAGGFSTAVLKKLVECGMIVDMQRHSAVRLQEP